MKFLYVLMVLTMALPGSAQYAGPAILSRGEAPSGLELPQIRFEPHVSFGGTYDSGLGTTAVTDTGQLASAGSYGFSVNWGVSGSHKWRHTTLGLDYSGSINEYAQQTAFNSINHAFLIGLHHQFTKHIFLNWSESAGIFSRNYSIGGLSETVPFDPSTSYIPRTDFFDNRTIYVTSSLNMTVQKSNRLSFNFGGQAFENSRQSHSLSSAWGAVAHGDTQYRLTRRSTIGVVYTYSHYGFAHVFGGTDAHSIAGSFSSRLSQRVEFSGYAGVMRFESKFLQSTPTDPIIAELLGINETLVVRHSIQTSPTFAGRLSRSMRRGVLYVSGGRSITAGNGLFLTSLTTSAMAGYGYTGLRGRWSLNAQFGYERATSDGTITGGYGNTTETVSVGRQLGRYTNFSASYASRVYSSAQFVNYNRRINTASVTIGFSPGEVRLPPH